MRRRLAIGEHILKSTGDRGKRIIQSIGDGAFGNALDPGPDSGHVLFQILGDEKFFQPANRIALLPALDFFLGAIRRRSEEHTSELQSLMRNSYAVFCLKKKNKKIIQSDVTSDKAIKYTDKSAP